MSILDLFMRGGLLMYVLLVISFVVLAIVLEKYRLLRRIKKQIQALHAALSGATSIKEIKSGIDSAEGDNPLGQMLRKLISSDTDDVSLIKESIESTAVMELTKLEKGMGWLSTCAAIAPLIGFLGTVIGMVNVFMSIQTQSQSGVDITVLAGGIWEALLTTIGGLIVGIIAIILYNDLVQHLENIAKDLQDHLIQYLIRFKSIKSGN
jgi:biopolymer transport protein ExbB